MNNTEFLRDYPHQKEFKNKRTHKTVMASKWGVNVRIDFYGKKYLKSGTTKGMKSSIISKESFNKKYYLHDNAL